MIDSFLRRFYFYLVLLVYKLLIPYKVEGWENVPDYDDGPYLIVANHFSYFEAPIMGFLLFNPKMRAFASPDTLGEYRLIDSLYRVYNDYIIYVDRGRVDRKALRAGIQTLNDGNWLLIFPEGGITQESIDVAKGGESTVHMQGGYYTREPAVLLPARPGAAMLAAQTNAKILPIVLWGTEDVEENLPRFRRTKITMRIGKALEPMTVPPDLRGRERRAYIDRSSEKIMQAMANLLPEKYRGPY